MRIAAQVLRYVLLSVLTVLGGTLAAVAYDALGRPGSVNLGFWIPFFVGACVANFLARWWSYAHPPRFSEAWQEDQITPDSL